MNLEKTFGFLAHKYEQTSLDVVGIMRRCGKKRKLDHAKHVQKEIYKDILEPETIDGNYIVPMLVECGSASDAQLAFNSLLCRNQHSWSSLLLGYIECGQACHALGMYQKMHDDSVDANSYSLTALLKACSRMKDLRTGHQIHLDIKKYGYEKDLYVGSTLIDMYAKCGSLAEGRGVLDNMPARNVVSWTALIAGYAEHGCGQEALKCFEEMQLEGIVPNAATYVCSLKACGCKGVVYQGREIHAEISQKEFGNDSFVNSSLVDMYAKCGAFGEAQEVLDKLPIQSIVSWNALIAGYVDYGLSVEALKCCKYMQVNGISPNAITFSCSIKACTNVGALDKGREIHTEIAQRGFEKDLVVGNALMAMYVKCDSLSEAQKVFVKLRIRDTISWTIIVSGYAENGLSEEALECFSQMQKQHISPNAVILVSVLKACGNIGDIERGRDIHAQISQQRLGNDLSVGKALVDMYAKCGSVAEAQQVFDNLPVKNVMSCNAIISAYEKNGQPLEALTCFEQMQAEGISQNAFTFFSALKASDSLGSLSKIRKVHSEAVKMGCVQNILVGNTLLAMYARFGSLLEAQEVFDKLPVRDAVAWTSIIAGYAENHFGLEALSFFDQMHLEGAFPDAITFVCSLKACSSSTAIAKGRKIHSEVVQKASDLDVSVGNSLINMYTKCGSLTEAEEVFNKMPVRDIISWNEIIAGLSEYGSGEKAMKCFDQMQSEGISPDAVTFVAILKAAGTLGVLGKFQETCARISLEGFEGDLFIGNTLIDMLANLGFLGEAREVFNKLPARNVVSWNAMITAYAEKGFGKDALDCFDNMQLEGMSPNSVTFVGSLKACGKIRALGKGKEVHTEVVEKRYDKEINVSNTLIDMYAKCGAIEEALEIFNSIPIQDIVAWNAVIAGYAEKGLGRQALKCLEHIQAAGISPDAVTFACSLKVCGNSGAIDRGRGIHAQIEKNGLLGNQIVANTLVDMYAKCGSLVEARQVFNKIPMPDIVSWNAIMGGYGMTYEGKLIINFFEAMQQQGIKPDDVTFICLLTVCSRCSLVDKGQEYFKIMRAEYGIMPSIDHYICMVDLLARTGRFHDAERLLESMPYAPSEEALTALLSACKTYGEVELGLRCFQQLVQLNPENAAAYMLMENAYAASGRWDDVKKIEELRKHSGAKKKLGRALIEVNKQIHEFVVGTNQSEEISRMLYALRSRMEYEGYAPNLDLVLKPISDGAKETSLCGHAERLAIAFGLLHTPQGHALRVTKNLRMCNNCHSACKIISRIERREIVLQECNWVHHFNNGLCSCEDMW